MIGFQADIVGNSVGPKTDDTENVLDDRGVIVKQFGEQGGQALVDDLASARHGTWSWGELRFTDSYGLDKSVKLPKKIVHLCVPSTYGGDGTYLVCIANQAHAFVDVYQHDELLRHSWIVL